MSNSSGASSSQAEPSPIISPLKWQEVGAWQGGAVVNVTFAPNVSSTGETMAIGLLASRAGVYQWTQAGATELGATESGIHLQALPRGLSDPNVIAVAFAGGAGVIAPPVFAAAITGRLYRGQYNSDASRLIAWEEIASWAGLGVALVLAPSPEFRDDHTLFVGTPAGIFRTLDDGQNWESCNFGLLDEEVLCLACAPNFAENEMLWAGTAGGGLYRSRNKARAWRESGFGLPDAAVQCLAVSPNFSQDRTLYAGMEGHGIYRSQDGGESWQSMALDGRSINSLSSAQADLMWAGSDDGLWRVSVKNGEAVQVTGAGEVVMSVAATAAGQVAVGLLGNGLWLTNDGQGEAYAMRWQKPPVALHTPPLIAGAGNELFALDSDGQIARSTDGGALWSEIERPLDDEVLALGTAMADKDNAARVAAFFAATGTGLARWRGVEDGWQDIVSATFSSQGVLAIEMSPAYADNRTLAVTTQANDLFLSQDDGLTWQEIDGPWQGQTLLHFHFSPNTPEEMVALSIQPDIANHFNMTAWQTLDLGKHWEVLAGLSSDLPAVIINWPADRDEAAIYLATQHRVIKLFVTGEHSALQVYQHFFDLSQQVTALAVAPPYEQSHTLWAATTGGLYRSEDRGIRWELMLETPLALPVVWLDVTSTEIRTITLGGRAWRAKL